MKRILLPVLVLGLLTSCEKPSSDSEKVQDVKDVHAVSGPLPAWQEGCLDIHFINTGTGESSFIIMPDGTQMLVDMAGALTNPSEELYVPRPQDTSRRPGEWINAYLSKLMGWTGNPVIDYVSVTHFHGDHFGAFSSSLPMSANGAYRMTSVADILDGNKVYKFVDRGWESYDYPHDMTTSSTMKNYISCVKWHKENKGVKVEKFEVASTGQFAMRRDAASYPGFKIRNIAVNGSLWTGTEKVELFPDKAKFTGTGESEEYSPSENHTSSVFRLSYGKFDFYSGGDISYNGFSYFDWKDAELPVAKSVGRVEVMKANHHGSYDANRQETLSALSPQVIVVNVWRNVQPRVATLKAMVSSSTNNGRTDVFTTNMTLKQKTEFGTSASRVLGKNGHVVIRVNPGGNEYYVYMLKDSDESMMIENRFGPYRCR